MTTDNTFEITDWSTHPDVVAALGEGEPLTEDQLRLLAILVDPTLDPFDNDDTRFAELLDEWSAFEGVASSELSSLAYRLELFHKRTDGDDCWIFQHIDDLGSGWYEVGSYLPGTTMHLTLGEDGKYLAGDRYNLTGLRAAIQAAETIEGTWLVARRTMSERGLIPNTNAAGRFVVDWSIDDTTEAATPEQAAAAIWRDVFGRNGANADDACVFTVTDTTTGETTVVDLSDHDLDELNQSCP